MLTVLFRPSCQANLPGMEGTENTFNYGRQTYLFSENRTRILPTILNAGLEYMRNVLIFKNVIASGKVSF